MRAGPEARSNPRSGVEAAHAPPRERVLIERVSPQLDGGRYAVKRVIGDTLRSAPTLIMPTQVRCSLPAALTSNNE